MSYCIVGIGSNIKPEYYCSLMIAALDAQFNNIHVSDLHRTSACGAAASDYMNGVAFFETTFNQLTLKHWCRSIEEKLGRVRGQIQCAADLDILYFSERQPTLDIVHTVDSYFKIGINQLLSRKF